jgi:hypothetical protein
VRRSRLLPLAAALGLAAALSLAAIAVPGEAESKAQTSKRTRELHRLLSARLGRTLARIHDARDETWRWQKVMSAPPTRYTGAAERSTNLDYRRSLLEFWSQRALAARRQAQHPPRMKQWLCIHSSEGPWNDPDPPYYGGLQMDITFQQAYGADLVRRKGTADHWTPLEQIWVAERAYRSGRGFYPWPNTARYCGVI